MKNEYTILLADDDDLNLEILTRTTDYLDYKSIAVDDGEKAWRAIIDKNNQIDLVILDRMMPGFSGLEIATKIKTDCQDRFLPVIIQSGKVGDDILKVAFNAGVIFYLQKPFKGETLEDFISIIIDQIERRTILSNIINENTPIDSGTYSFNDLTTLYSLAAKIGAHSQDKLNTANSLSEVMLNSLEHGNLGIGLNTKTNLIRTRSYKNKLANMIAENKAKQIMVDVKINDKEVIVKISDQGNGFDYKKFAEFNSDNIINFCGRGIYLARQYIKIDYSNNGSEAICSFTRE